jgi:biopolymer transport protein ExbD
VSNPTQEITTVNAPHINVTPLIDVLLVLLIIFMVVAPTKPSAFKARIPAEPKQTSIGIQNPKALVVTIGTGQSLTINGESAGTVNKPDPLIIRLKNIFELRIASGDVSDSFANDTDRPAADRIERTVFVKAPRNIDYGSVARIVDAAKSAGAYPISLQIDHLQ